MREFESEHILYREMTVDDTDNVLTWRNSEAVRSQFFYQDIITKEDHLNYIDNKIKTGKSLQFILKDKETDEEFGCCYFSNIEGKIAEIGIFFGVTNFKGKGYGKETIKRFSEYGFNDLGFERIDTRIKSGNMPSIMSHKRAGFIENDELYDKYEFNCNRDEIVFMSLYKDMENK